MVKVIAEIFVMAILGSLSVPITLLALARFGLFHQIDFKLFGRKWHIAPRSGKSLS